MARIRGIVGTFYAITVCYLKCLHCQDEQRIENARWPDLRDDNYTCHQCGAPMVFDNRFLDGVFRVVTEHELREGI